MNRLDTVAYLLMAVTLGLVGGLIAVGYDLGSSGVAFIVLATAGMCAFAHQATRSAAA